MSYYKIVIEPLDFVTDAYLKTLGGYNIGAGQYILDIDRDCENLKGSLAETAESVEVVAIEEPEFEAISREKKGSYAPKPKNHSVPYSC
ncbi:MAG TPA: hypothetical protein VH302_01705 [Bryobacteraceae bacterium]|nr:hypothetical protein [Bryobacteraceae bacterium]